MKPTRKQRIAIFASGNGSNAGAIIEYFHSHTDIEVALLVCNRPQAGVVDLAREQSIPLVLIDRKGFYESEKALAILREQQIDCIVLAGFLWLVPSYLTDTFPNRIVNIHPALLPDFGGKGMYGIRVHQAVIDSGKKESGITIHYVNEVYDQGEYIFQAKVAVSKSDTAESLAEKVLQLEHYHYPRQIEKLLSAASN